MEEEEVVVVVMAAASGALSGDAGGGWGVGDVAAAVSMVRVAGLNITLAVLERDALFPCQPATSDSARASGFRGGGAGGGGWAWGREAASGSYCGRGRRWRGCGCGCWGGGLAAAGLGGWSAGAGRARRRRWAGAGLVVDKDGWVRVGGRTTLARRGWRWTGDGVGDGVEDDSNIRCSSERATPRRQLAHARRRCHHASPSSQLSVVRLLHVQLFSVFGL